MTQHVKGQPYRYRHGWIPLAKTDFRSMIQGSTNKQTALSPNYNEIPEIRGTSRTKGSFGGKSGRDLADAAKLASMKHSEIRKQDLSPSGQEKSRAVSPAEFQKIAAMGAAEYERMKRNGGPTTGLNEHWTQTVARAYSDSRKPWGGATIDSHTGEFLPQGADKYAMTVRGADVKPISVSADASPSEFAAAMTKARTRYGPILSRQSHALGVFHDADKHTIEFDPVLVTDQKHHTETIGAYTHAVGGAYHFKSGNGFWPPHVVAKDLAERKTLTDKKMTGKATAIDSAVLAFKSHMRTGKFDPQAQVDTAAPSIGDTIRATEAKFGFNRRRWPKRLLRAAAPYDPLAQLMLGGSGAKRTRSKVSRAVPKKVRTHRKHPTKTSMEWSPTIASGELTLPNIPGAWSSG